MVWASKKDSGYDAKKSQRGRIRRRPKERGTSGKGCEMEKAMKKIEN